MLNVEVVGRHQQLETQLGREVHIWHVARIFVLLVVVQIFADFFQYYAAVKLSTCARMLGWWTAYFMF